MFGRRKVASLVAEFLGTGVLTLLILSVQRSQLGLSYFVAIGAGLAVTLMTFVVGEYSGGYFNPAVTLGLWTARKLSTTTGLMYMVAQFVGAYAALGLYTYFSNTHLSKVGGHYNGRILIAEAVGTGIFSFGLAATLYRGYSQTSKAIFAGLSYMLAIMAVSSATLGLLNPAVALGVKAWVWGTYVLGPLLGAVIGINLYALVFAESDAALGSRAATPVVATAAAKTTKKTTKRKSSRKK